ncbi:PREDICTED: protein tramtrack, alpha isoform-like isoform X1 [Atta colombica]|uniref:protein tramtrack, alpha isoform-like isoform X1 n=1 Tax=Atta colombica TaxID=520822 RepID=UPI00084BD4B2|nr:PREDICTED: protein tramtrack, alpha isoform-like isoform X1 [Atta colombica]XP_018052533.1 PREDICTED: protein tramtrack, alpha isoform-like isoform X1 [Atta colombica]XP_018052542.1 PREDICTED: protein tramtrack, alpha isoform-like isoform X1 [Atta colombica]XP_018052552.1 PREDICTED: protein tramtrack, alpha isoform-like isoform X1 [Atta colombica]XP_018052561.1 PREDICTED: protein tramtrack, alpha isoform-like isoform X1 [Atta colombica]XP_018052570.1 PREDICTED: protein tramtrack, alpha isof
MLADINGNLADLRSEAMASQRFCLRWNNHQSNLLSVFDQLLHDEAFVDVTLAVEGQLLRAHKMVLSACSPYFQALFVGHPDKHPIVILKDVPYVDMRSLLDFMYRGEVSVDQDRLTAFLRVAESLRIKGLTEVNEDKCDLPSITSSLLGGSQNAVAPPPPSLHRINQIGPHHHHHHVAQKRFHHMSSHPLLGSALTAPKRKRGRPRKLSGSSDTPIGEIGGQDLQSCSGADLVQGSPEMMEMKMGLDFQSEVSGNGSVRNASASSSNNVGTNSATNNPAAAASSGSSTRRDEPTENGTDTPEPVTRVKREPEPTPSTSAQASDETFARPHSRQGSEGFKQDQLPSQLPNDITFEVCSSSSPSSPAAPASSASSSATHGGDDKEDISSAGTFIKTEKDSGVHFLTNRTEEDQNDLLLPKSEASDNEPEVRKQLLEYLIQNDGSVVCKWCGEVLPSRTRWYRHKYKLHVSTQVAQPAPLFKCHSCNTYFKSRKGYIGHLSSRHSDNENDENREEPTNKKSRKTSTDTCRGPDWELQREKEEKLVADIIDRVKRECEAQGETVTRRGYSRRSTIMNS